MNLDNTAMSLMHEKRLKMRVVLDGYIHSFRSTPQTHFLASMVTHLAPKYSAHEVKKILQKAVETLDHFPSIAQIETIASEMGFNDPSKEKKPDIKRYCASCGGDGYFLVEHTIYKSLAAASCESCTPGEDLRSRDNHKMASLSEALAKGYTLIKSACAKI